MRKKRKKSRLKRSFGNNLGRNFGMKVPTNGSPGGRLGGDILNGKLI